MSIGLIIEGGKRSKTDNPDLPLEPSAQDGLKSIIDGKEPPFRNRLRRPKEFDDGQACCDEVFLTNAGG